METAETETISADDAVTADASSATTTVAEEQPTEISPPDEDAGTPDSENTEESEER